MKKNLPVFEVDRLRIERDAVILRDVNWRVDPGQHWALLGANGSGKTSLLSAVTGYLVPTHGEIRIGGATFGTTDWRDVRRGLEFHRDQRGQVFRPRSRRAGICKTNPSRRW